MKKELPILTDEEKINLLANLKVYSTDEKINGHLWTMKMIPITTITALTISTALMCFWGFNLVPALMVCGFLAATTIPIFESLPLSCYIPSLKEFKSYTNNKLSYKQYKKLIKSGEVETWQQQFKTQIEEKVIKMKGFETSIYQKDAEQQIINDVYNNLSQTDVKLDADKVAEQVRKMINENNKNNEREN